MGSTCKGPELCDAMGGTLGGFFGFLRAGEFTVKNAAYFDPSSSLRLEDIAVDQHENLSVIRIRLKSKTDPFRHGVDIFLSRKKADHCPVAALLAFVAVRPSVAGLLFVFQDGSFLSRDKLVSAVQSALQQAGIDAKSYKGHSFRIGAATTAVEGLYGQNARQVGVLGLPTVYSYPKGNLGNSVGPPSVQAPL